MRRIIFSIMAAAALLTSCASSRNVINDDAYYSPYDKDSQNNNTLVTSNYGYFDASLVNNDQNIEVEPDTVYIVDETPETRVIVELGTGFYYDPYWYPSWSPYWSFSTYYYWGYPYYSYNFYYPYYHYYKEVTLPSPSICLLGYVQTTDSNT